MGKSRGARLWLLVDIAADIPSATQPLRAGLSQDIWFRDWPTGYDLTELAKHYPAFDETFSLIWFG